MDLNATVLSELTSGMIDVKANVAIASAITAYARVEMMKYKLNDTVCYTDTDSIFTTEKLTSFHIGPELGQMKDELGGLLINEAYFLDIKKYGYWFLDNNGNRHECSVIAGIARNSVSFKDFEELVKGNTLTISRENVFYKSLNKLSIEIKNFDVQVKNNMTKSLINNKYSPIVINDFSHQLYQKYLKKD